MERVWSSDRFLDSAFMVKGFQKWVALFGLGSEKIRWLLEGFGRSHEQGMDL